MISSTSVPANELLVKSKGPPEYGGGVPEQCDRVVGESRLIHRQVMGAIARSGQLILTALYRDTALYRPPYWRSANRFRLPCVGTPSYSYSDSLIGGSLQRWYSYIFKYSK